MSHPAVALAVTGKIPPTVALARLLLDGLTPDEIEAILPPSSAIAALFATHSANLAETAEMLRQSAVDHGVDPLAPGDRVAAIAAMFDRAVALSPDASVAAYSLGDAALLAAATREIVDWLVGGGYAGPSMDVLDLGCGTGRVAAALAQHVRSVLGIDISAGMIAEARRRHDAPNLRFAQTDGAPIDLPRASLDLILAVDSMPYLVQAGIADAHVADARRLLRPGAHLVILNLSYRNDAVDRTDAHAWGTLFDMTLVVTGARPFATWDGAAYVFRAPTKPERRRASVSCGLLRIRRGQTPPHLGGIAADAGLGPRQRIFTRTRPALHSGRTRFEQRTHRSSRPRDQMRNAMMDMGNKKRDQKLDIGLAWFRITVVVAALGLCTGKFLIWLHI